MLLRNIQSRCTCRQYAVIMMTCYAVKVQREANLHEFFLKMAVVFINKLGIVNKHLTLIQIHWFSQGIHSTDRCKFLNINLRINDAYSS